jgi:hypothetical protein
MTLIQATDCVKDAGDILKNKDEKLRWSLTEGI